MFASMVYAFAGFGCVVLVYLIACCISRAWRDLKSLEAYAKGDDDWL